ncbi:MAG: class IV adenylate cyclase [Bryobacteraceae bacterium]
MTTSNRETEIKLAVPDAASAAALLQRAGFHESAPRAFESNELWDFADSRLRSSRQILRIRECRGQTVLTYKGPPEAGPHKVREELEVGVDSAAPLRLIAGRLGLTAGYRYEKYRTEFSLPSGAGVATLDETPIGTFLELEGEASWIDAMAASLGFAPGDYILASYATLWNEYARRNGLDPAAGMVFPRAFGDEAP